MRGVAVIETLRRKGFRGKLTLITEQKLPLYSPTTLPYLLDGNKAEQLVLRPHSFFNDIEVIEAQALSVDEQRSRVILTDGRKVSYGKLVVATGASPVVPFPAPPDVPLFTVRKLSDITQIGHKLKRNMTVLLVGAGLIGLHLAQVFLSRGQKLHLVEVSDQILPGLVHAELAEEIRRRFIEKGAIVSLGSSIDHLEEHHAVLADGNTTGFDFAVAAAGVRPNIETLKETSVATAAGIRVNPWMETSVPAILACGDVAEYHDFFTGAPRLNPNIMNAVEQGRVAAGRLVGEEEPHPGVISCMTCVCLEMTIFSVGRVMPDENDQVFEEADAGTHVYRRLIASEGRLKGAVFCNTPVDHGLFYNLIKQKVSIDGMEKKILREPLHWAKVLAK